MAFVLDASVTLSWLLDDEEHPAALRAQTMAATQPAHVPAIWWFEVRNALLVQERRGRLTPRDTMDALRVLARIRIEPDRDPREAAVLDLARQHRLTVYDAAYLELARREHLPLATLDRRLAAAARAEDVALIGEPS